MSRSQWRSRTTLVAVLLLLTVSSTALAQLQTGNVYGKVNDPQGGPLPGVTVTLDTGAAQIVQVTNAQGEYRFLSLPPAAMKLKAELQGFGTVEHDNVVISVGHNTTVDITMAPSTVKLEDTITVTGDNPLLDERSTGRGATVSAVELKEIPTSRDPWTVLQSVPGVQVDRVNVGGNESSQQSLYVGPGSASGNSVWSVDGVVITDMSALGSSPSYYDFDAFEEMQVTTGGTDSTLATGGVVLNMVTKRGTNDWRGSARYLNTPNATESKTSLSTSQLVPGEAFAPSYNQIRGIDDFGGDIGGPIVKDHIWIWGSYGNQKISTITSSFPGKPGVPYTAEIPTYNGKANAQISQSNSAVLFAMQNEKTVVGRNASPTRPLPSAWDQGLSGSKPTAAKVEDTQVFGPNFYLTGMYSDVNGGFHLSPIGGLDPTTFLDANGIWHNSFVNIVTLRPQHQGKLDASSFFNTGNVANELKYGAGYRHVETSSLSQWAGAGYILDPAVAGTNPANGNFFLASRPSVISVTNNYLNAYGQDTMTFGNFTANLGVRWDRQTGSNNAATIAANPANSALLPGFQYSGGPAGFSWSDVTPRLGLTYALGKERKTLLRASYSRFADQLGAGFTSTLNPGVAQSYYYFYTPSSGPGVPTSLTPTGFGYSGNVNPATGLPVTANQVASNFHAPLTDEFLAGIEHAILPELVVGLNLNYRRLSGIVDTDLLVFDPGQDPYASTGRPATRADYVPVTFTGNLPNGQPYSVTDYFLKPGLTTRNGFLLTNGDRTQDYKAASLTMTKRLSNRWMARGSFTWSDWTWGNTQSLPDPSELLGGGQRNGDQVLVPSGAASGPKAYVFINAKWQGNVNALYQILPEKAYGFNVAGSFTYRQGYPIDYFLQKTLGTFAGTGTYIGAPRVNYLVGSTDTPRLEDVYDFDARIEKELRFDDFGLTLGVDCFNVFNSSTVLQRYSRVNLATSGYVYEILSPRVFRFGARVNFR